MNWATITPETRLYKGKNLFKWDVSPGLEHHCGVCAIPLHNVRAKSSCIGSHVEPCYRFHQQLHFVGKSHECFGCNTSDEMHHNRHKEILKIIRQISALDGEAPVVSPFKLIPNDKLRRESSTTPSTDSPADTSSEFAGDERMTKRERKKTRKCGVSVTKDRRKVEAFPQDSLDFVSEAIHLSIVESKGAWEGTYVYDINQTSFVEKPLEDIEDDSIEEEKTGVWADKINISSFKLATEMTPRQRKVAKKFTTSSSQSRFGSGSRKFTLTTPKKNDPYDGVDPKIFFRFGIEVANAAVNSKARKDLVARLIAAVKDDIDTVTREEHECEMREKGFWIWAGKGPKQKMQETRKQWDWATGQKKSTPKREDFADDEMDVIEIIEGVEVEGDEVVTPIVTPPAPDKFLKTHKPTITLKITENLSTPETLRIPEMVTVEAEPFKKARIELQVAESWTILKSKGSKAKGVNTQEIKVKKIKFKDFNSKAAKAENYKPDINEDMDDMILRYTQMMRGDRNIGIGSESQNLAQVPKTKILRLR